ncbi:hypothetical protein GAO09_08225 [Rhizobiales bacterium RZME27]|uniref:Lectin-like protein BA14k n=1 Tax=Endobacterium cereale TaxID=2663029 RepID=A0A6A8A4B3_9HYPH|nr:hypothetical protein [Endobacterium cereale]
MRELFTSRLLATCLLPVAAGGLKVASEVAQQSKPHSFTNLHDEPLWPSEVKRVDRNQQAYQRLPAAQSGNTIIAELKPVERTTRTLGSPTDITTSDEQNTLPKSLSAELQASKSRGWCSARYRSFDPVSNTYQPYGGGPRQPCSPPNPAASAQQVADNKSGEEMHSNALWCMQRYSSYRLDDNTYQPFSGGRKQCAGPEAQSASNSVRNPTIARF